jgi:Domain of unknown function (DUF222)
VVTERPGIVVNVLEVVRGLRATLVEFEPGGYSGEQCAALVEELAGLEKVSAAARNRAAVRAGAEGVHRERGFADVGDWLARATGSSVSSAKAALGTAATFDRQPEVAQALRGELSMAQAQELAKTEAACPGSAVGLLGVATSQSLKALREEARQRRVRSIDPEDLHQRQQEAREFRHWRTALGTVGFAGELPPEVGVPFVNQLEAETDRLWKKARRAASGAVGADGGSHHDGRKEPRRSALAADAFVTMLAGGGNGRAGRADLVIVCDLQAYRRGRAEEGEACHIVGGGPIPVSLARTLERDAFLKAVLYDGTRIDTIAHFGRRVPAVLRTALELGPAPHFDGLTCAVAGCDRRFHLQQDHIDPVANGGVTALRNYQPLCFVHHQMKTEEDRAAGRLGQSGSPRRGPP